MAAQAKRLGEVSWAQPQTKGEGPSPRAGHTLTVDPKAGKAVLFGGSGVTADGAPAVFNETWLLSTAEPMAWEKAGAKGDAPSPRWRHTATLLPDDGGVLIFGGLHRGRRFNDTHVFHTERKEWEIRECSGSAPPPRSHHTASLVAVPSEEADAEEGAEVTTASEQKIFIIGGYGGAGTTRDFLSDLHMLDLATWSWTKARHSAAPHAAARSQTTRAPRDRVPLPMRANCPWLRCRPPPVPSPGRERARQPAKGSVRPHCLRVWHDHHCAGRSRLVGRQGLHGPL